MKKLVALLAAAFVGAFTLLADGESLAETGGYVTTEAQLAFKGITLADLGTTYVPSAKMSGGWVTADGMPVSFNVRTVVDGAVRYQAQAVEGNVKAVAIEFTDGEGGVYVRAYDNQGFYNSDLTKFGNDIYISSSTFAGAIATSADDGTYGIHDLGLVSVDDLDAICLNFNDSNDTMLKTYESVGPDAYAVTGFMWSQMLGTNNNTMNGVRLIDSETSATLDLPSVTVAITGTRGTWSTGSYNSSSDVRYGYIDENENNTTPTVTISNVPFEFYKVVFIPSTDSGDSKFGYITVNGKNYSSANTEKASDQDYDIVADSTAAWGKTQVADYLHGVNYLVTPVLEATSDGSVKVVGHKSNGRGCIAAVQIVKETIPEITATAITAAQINAAVPSGESFLKVPAGATITLDESLTASKIKIVSSGTVTLAANEQPSAEYLAKIDVSSVKGAVLRSWLTPGVVGFNFNANGARNYSGAYGIEDGASDTSLALEIGTWYKDASSREGSSTALFADGLSTLTWWSNNLYCEVANPENGTFIQGYLDDGSSGATIALSGVPYETYDLILYCSTDTANSKFSAKTVNGAYYAWDATSGEVVEVSEITSSAAWGNSTLAAGKAVYGANTIRINGLSGALSINSKNVGGRGCIAAIQIMPAGTSTAPTMTVGTVGEATDATWTDSGLWEGGVVPSSGTAKIIVAGDVTLTIDDNISLSAVTVEGSGSLKLVKGDDATVAFDSLSAATVQIVLPDSSISISTLSAPVKYLYKTETVASTLAGNTYTQGAGTSEAAVSIAHNGGSATLTGGTYYFAQSHSGTATTVTFHDATAEYAAECGIGMAAYIVEGTSSISAQRLILSQGADGRTAAMTVKDTASVNVTGTSDVDSNTASIMFGHWNGPSTFTIQDSATFTAASQVLVGKTRNDHVINVNGGTFTARGIKTAGYASGTNTLNLNGGLLVLGDVGITSYGSTRIGVNVLGDSEIRASAATLPITQPVAISAGKTLSFMKDSSVAETGISLSGAVTGTGNISVGSGVTLNLGTNRPEGEISVDDDGALTVVMTSKADTPVLKVSSEPSNITLYDTDGTTVIAGATVDYDGVAGTITVKPPTPKWTTKSASGSFDAAENWSTGEVPTSGDAVIELSQDTTISISGTHTLSSLTISGTGKALLSGAGIVAADTVYVIGETTLAHSGQIEAAGISLAPGTVLKLDSVTESAAISGEGAVETYGTVTFNASNAFTGGLTVKPGSTAKTIKKGIGGQAYGKNNYGQAIANLSRIVVESGGSLDLANTGDACYAITIAGNGVEDSGALFNSGAAIGSNSRQTASLTLSADAMVKVEGVGNGWGLVNSGHAASVLALNGHTLTVSGLGDFPIVNANTASGTTTTGTLVLDGATLGLVSTASNLSGVNIVANGCSSINLATAPSALGSLTLKPTKSGTTASAWNLPSGLVPVVDATNIVDPVAGPELTLFTAPNTTTLSASTITAKINGRYTTEISGNTVTATYHTNGVAYNFLHYDFDGGADVETGVPIDTGTTISSFGEAETKTFEASNNGKAVKVFFVSTSDCYTPYWGEYANGTSPFHAGEVTVTTVAKIDETNIILWGLGAAAANKAMGLVVTDAHTAAVVARNGTADVVALATVTVEQDLTSGWHFFAVVSDEDGTKLYVDQNAPDSTNKGIPAGIGQAGQLGSFHGGPFGANKVGTDGYLLDDWRVYDTALTADEVAAIRDELVDYTPSGIDPTADEPTYESAAADEDAAEADAKANIVAPDGVDAAEYAACFKYEVTGSAGAYTVTIVGIAEETETAVEISALEVLEGTATKISVPAGLYYKIETFTELGGEAVNTYKDKSDGTGVAVDRPGTTQGFIKVQLGAKAFN